MLMNFSIVMGNVYQESFIVSEQSKHATKVRSKIRCFLQNRAVRFVAVFRCRLRVIHVDLVNLALCPVIGPLQTWRFVFEDVSLDVNRAHKLERRIMRYELNDREWAVIKLASVRIWLRANESAP